MCNIYIQYQTYSNENLFHLKQKNEKQNANNLTQIPSINSKEANW